MIAYANTPLFWDTLGQIPRLNLAQFPTPLLAMPRLATKLNVKELWFKRDDLISFGLGGNKIRGLEFLMADALAQHADYIVTGAGVQSNHVRATAAASAYCNLRCKAVFWGRPPDQVDGNYRVTRMLGAESFFTGDPDRASVDQGIARICGELIDQGHQPYPIPRGGACALGALGHVLAAHELYEQCDESGFMPDLVVLAAGSGGTHAGWLLGTHLLGNPWQTISVTVSREVKAVRAEIARIANETAFYLHIDWQFTPEKVAVHDGFIGEGYGIPSPEGANAIRLVGRSEGVLLDPTYTGKAMAGLIDLSQHELAKDRSIVFLHSGGEPAFFAGAGNWLQKDTNVSPTNLNR